MFRQQPSFIEIESPVNICGDIHGQYVDLLRIFGNIGFPNETCRYLFLGDYVDRGKNSIESICLLLLFKIKYPEHIFLLRGNHEAAAINRIYGFYDECKRKFSIKLWKKFVDVFNWMPITASIDSKILCMHGGLSPDLKDLDCLRKIVRPTDIPSQGLLCDLLWSDPEKIYFSKNKWGENERGISCTFNQEVVKEYLDKLDMDLIVRAHQVVEQGYEFYSGKKLVTIFSAPNYCGEFDNLGGVICVDENLKCSFKLIKPLNEKVYSSLKHRAATPPKKNN